MILYDNTNFSHMAFELIISIINFINKFQVYLSLSIKSGGSNSPIHQFILQ